jgi:hypothetical protein
MSIECIHCKKSLSAEEVFDNAIDAREAMWNGFKCIHCGKVALFVLKGNQLEIGMIDGFPGPVFTVESAIIVKELVYNWQGDYLKISLNKKEWLVPRKKHLTSQSSRTKNSWLSSLRSLF